MSTVVLVRCPSYDRGTVEDAVEAGLSALPEAEPIRPGESLLLKPNLLAAIPPGSAATTHPEVVRAVALFLARRGARLSCGDSPALDDPGRALRISGLAAVLEELGLPEADFRRSVSVPFPEGHVLRRMDLAKAVADADGVVGISKLKTHALTGLTGAVKNLYGCVAGREKALGHFRHPSPASFARMVADVAACVAPRFHVMDAVVAMEGNGPRNGRPRPLGFLLFSADPVALDAVAAHLVRIAPDTVPTLAAGAARGLGIRNPDRIRVSIPRPADRPASVPDGIFPCRTMPDSLRIDDFEAAETEHSLLAAFFRRSGRLGRKALVHRPVIAASDCILCGQCINACPTDPVSLCRASDRDVPVYDYGRCIRCYCCQEICPAGAIRVRRAPLAFLLGR